MAAKSERKTALHVIPGEPTVGLVGFSDRRGLVVSPVVVDPGALPFQSLGRKEMWERVPVVDKVGHMVQMFSDPERARLQISLGITAESIASGRTGLRQATEFANSLQSGDARQVLVDFGAAVAIEGLILLLNTPMAGMTVIFSENPLIGFAQGFALGLVVQGAIRSAYYVPRRKKEVENFESYVRTDAQAAEFQKLHKILALMCFMPVVGTFMAPFISYFRNKRILEQVAKNKLRGVAKFVPGYLTKDADGQDGYQRNHFLADSRLALDMEQSRKVKRFEGNIGWLGRKVVVKTDFGWRFARDGEIKGAVLPPDVLRTKKGIRRLNLVEQTARNLAVFVRE